MRLGQGRILGLVGGGGANEPQHKIRGGVVQQFPEWSQIGTGEGVEHDLLRAKVAQDEAGSERFLGVWPTGWQREAVALKFLAERDGEVFAHTFGGNCAGTMEIR